MCSQNVFPIARSEQVYKRIQALSHRSVEIKGRLASHLKLLWNPERPLKRIDDTQVFTTLYERFPNFSEVIEYYEINAIATIKLNQPFEAMPVLLQGEPGLGKTYFASELARLIGFNFYEISLSTVSANFTISGGSTQWSEGSVGFVATSLIESDHANPFLLIDEIDKASKSSQYEPMAPFYSLLEPHSARRFKDEALEIELDTSKIIWVATSNDMKRIPQPILSRLRVFNIKSPSIDHIEKVILSIYDNLKNETLYGQLLSDQLSAELIKFLSDKTPRQIKHCLETGAMRAVKCDRSAICLSDMSFPVKQEVYRVGFI